VAVDRDLLVTLTPSRARWHRRKEKIRPSSILVRLHSDIQVPTVGSKAALFDLGIVIVGFAFSCQLAPLGNLR